MEQIKKKRRRRISKILYQIIAVGFAGIIVLFMIISIIIPDKKYSEEENRVLTEFSKPTIETIMDQTYMTDLECYVSDQFFLRDFWIRLKVQCDLIAGKREFNGVYLGKGKYLMQIPTEPDQKNLQNNLDAMNQFAEKNNDIDMYVMIVPNSVYIMQDYLPKGAPVRDQGKDMQTIEQQLSEKLECLDISSTLKKHVDEGIYYKTDHHWTSKGAFYGFKAVAEQMGIDHPITDYNIYSVTDDFSGTLASKSGYHKTKDSIEIYAPNGTEVQYLVSNSDEQEKKPTVYQKEALNEKDKYQVFFGGNHAMVDITTTNKTNRRLLVFKDSYANCFVPFLIPYYNEIIMIDPRYYYDDVENMIEQKGISDILFLYNMDTFLNDNSLADVLAEE